LLVRYRRNERGEEYGKMECMDERTIDECHKSFDDVGRNGQTRMKEERRNRLYTTYEEALGHVVGSTVG
jgi:hypothetical protein